MRRSFVRKPVLASTQTFWSTEVNSIEDIQAEIQKALDAGTTFEDVDDYLNELYSLNKINDEEFSELINWAAPLTTNGDSYVEQPVSAHFEIRRQNPDRKCSNCARRYDELSGGRMCPGWEQCDTESQEINQAHRCDRYIKDEKLEDEDYEEDYTPSATHGDYSPSSPWNAPGMSMSDFF